MPSLIIHISNDNSSNDDSDVESKNPNNAERACSDKTCLIPNIYNSDQGVLDIAPGEGKQPFSQMSFVKNLHSCSYFQICYMIDIHQEQ